MVQMGFEPTPPKRLELESSALDRSATEPERVYWSRFMIYYALCNGYVKKKVLPGFEPGLLDSKSRVITIKL